jgi:AraC family transcriptional regulator of adaptative response / DNA-3-methyladenine glycosylase II
VPTIRLSFRPPLHALALLEFFAHRTVAGVDEVSAGTYRRGLELAGGPATIEVTPGPTQVRARLDLTDPGDLPEARSQVRRLCDLDADPVAIDAVLAGDPALADAVHREPGVRVPGAVDGFEMAVRAIVGQQISVAGARIGLARLVSGARIAPEHGFPSPSAVAAAPDEAFGMPAARRRTLRMLATEVACGRLVLDPSTDRTQAYTRLLAIPGIGPWTAQYVGLRALRDPDVLLATDLGVRRGAAALGLPDEPARLADHAARHWAPWRSYATIRLWRAA